MEKIEVVLQREQKRKKRKAIQDRIAELTSWLCKNDVSNKHWDIKVRELHAMELQLEVLDAPRRKSDQVEYGVSLPAGMALQY